MLLKAGSGATMAALRAFGNILRMDDICVESWVTWAPAAADPGRRPEAAGVPRLRLGGHRRPRRRRRSCAARASASSANLRGRARERARSEGTHRHRPHPLGHPRRAHRRATPTRTPTAPAMVVVHNGIIENYLALQERAAGARATASQSETDTEIIAHLIERARRAADLARAPCAAPLERSRRHLRHRRACRASEPERSSSARARAPPAGRRPRRGRELRRLATSRRSSPTPATSSSSRTARSPCVTPRAASTIYRPRRQAGRRARRSASTGPRCRPRRAATSTSCSRRSTSSRAPSRTPCAAASRRRDGRRLPRRASAPDRRGRARASASVMHRRLRHRASTPAWSASYLIEDARRASPSRSSYASEFRYRDPIVDRSTLVDRHQPVGRDGRHAGGPAARPSAAARTRARRRATWSAAPSPREADGALYTARRPRDRRGLHQGLHHAARRALLLAALPRPHARHAPARPSARDLHRRAARSCPA